MPSTITSRQPRPNIRLIVRGNDYSHVVEKRSVRVSVIVITYVDVGR